MVGWLGIWWAGELAGARVAPTEDNQRSREPGHMRGQWGGSGICKRVSFILSFPILAFLFPDVAEQIL